MTELLCRAMRSAALSGLAAASGGLAVATAVGFFGSRSAVLDLAAHFRMPYVVLLVPTLLGAAALRSRQAVVLAGLALAANLAVMAPLYALPRARPSAASDADDSAGLRVLVFNVHTANQAHLATVDYVNSSDADLVFLQETDQAWLSAVMAGATEYQLVTAEPRGDNFGLLALTAAEPENRFSVVRAEVVDSTGGDSGLPAIELEIQWRGQLLGILAVHTMPPVSPRGASLRDRQLDHAAGWVARRAGPSIVIGDLNATPWSDAFRKLIARTGLDNSMLGFGYYGTWQAAWPAPLRIPIDHLLHDPALVTVRRHVGPNLGSDHRPLLVTLAWRESSAHDTTTPPPMRPSRR